MICGLSECGGVSITPSGWSAAIEADSSRSTWSLWVSTSSNSIR